MYWSNSAFCSSTATMFYISLCEQIGLAAKATLVSPSWEMGVDLQQNFSVPRATNSFSTSHYVELTDVIFSVTQKLEGKLSHLQRKHHAHKATNFKLESLSLWWSLNKSHLGLKRGNLNTQTSLELLCCTELEPRGHLPPCHKTLQVQGWGMWWKEEKGRRCWAEKWDRREEVALPSRGITTGGQNAKICRIMSSCVKLPCSHTFRAGLEACSLCCKWLWRWGRSAAVHRSSDTSKL